MTIEQTEKALESTLKQNWLLNTYGKHYTDQFGFKIEYQSRKVTYRLTYKDELDLTVNSLTAAKMISTIYLNDVIMFKK